MWSLYTWDTHLGDTHPTCSRAAGARVKERTEAEGACPGDAGERQGTFVSVKKEPGLHLPGHLGVHEALLQGIRQPLVHQRVADKGSSLPQGCPELPGVEDGGGCQPPCTTGSAPPMLAKDPRQLTVLPRSEGCGPWALT